MEERHSEHSASSEHSTVCVREAEATLDALRGALAKAGITLPSLGLDPAGLAREAPCPLVDLGRCTVETAARLVAALR
ncbi:hypothetical protein [Streptomyces sp. NPDC046985]|uniref:hypothetical protein n=1 Tax=Streptomyces sp. NPDC046985 TaxID=3155377 RepID=UPI0033C44061